MLHRRKDKSEENKKQQQQPERRKWNKRVRNRQSQPEMLFTKDTKRRGKQNTASILCLFQLQWSAF